MIEKIWNFVPDKLLAIPNNFKIMCRFLTFVWRNTFAMLVFIFLSYYITFCNSIFDMIVSTIFNENTHLSILLSSNLQSLLNYHNLFIVSMCACKSAMYALICCDVVFQCCKRIIYLNQVTVYDTWLVHTIVFERQLWRPLSAVVCLVDNNQEVMYSNFHRKKYWISHLVIFF